MRYIYRRTAQHRDQALLLGAKGGLASEEFLQGSDNLGIGAKSLERVMIK